MFCITFQALPASKRATNAQHTWDMTATRSVLLKSKIMFAVFIFTIFYPTNSKDSTRDRSKLITPVSSKMESEKPEIGTGRESLQLQLHSASHRIASTSIRAGRKRITNFTPLRAGLGHATKRIWTASLVNCHCILTASQPASQPAC